jgi:threonine synthase
MAHGIKNAITLLMDEKFDAGQAMIKKFNSEEYADFKAENNFVSFNSIQILRVIAQVVYYFRAYAQLVDMGKIKTGDKIDFSVASGNFGDALAGRFAKEMGLPIRKINVATNKNNILEEFIQTGTYRRRRNPDGSFATSMTSDAPSQDIDVSSNFERELYLSCNGDTGKIKRWMKDLNDPKKGFFKVDPETLKNIKMLYTGTKAEDKDIRSTQKWTASECNKIIDPHTATDVYPYVNETRDIPMVCLSTSHSVQFDLIKGIDPNAAEHHEYDEHIKPLQDRMDNGEVREGEHFLTVGKVTPEALKAKVQEAVAILNARQAA